MHRDPSWTDKRAAIVVVVATALFFAAPGIGWAQASLLTAGRSAVMIQFGLDQTSIEQKTKGMTLLKLDATVNGQPWGAVTGCLRQVPVFHS